jgi:Lhr-like helicase
MTDKQILELIYSLSKLDEYKRKEIAILLLSTTLNPFAVEQLAGFMVGLNESVEDVIPDKYQAITNDNADYFVVEENKEAS